MRIWIILVLVACSFTSNAGLITGYITNEDGEPLPFASVYILGTTIGTASNPEGYFELPVPEGEHEFVFQYIGYKQHRKRITIGEEILSFSIILVKEEVSLDEVVISANAEDPAYRIIRNAIKRRKYYLQQVENYMCGAYTKGIFRITEAPDKMFGDSLNTKADSRPEIIPFAER